MRFQKDARPVSHQKNSRKKSSTARIKWGSQQSPALYEFFRPVFPQLLVTPSRDIALLYDEDIALLYNKDIALLYDENIALLYEEDIALIYDEGITLLYEEDNWINLWWRHFIA